ncbi:RagB/SusD family nutrient uptake outer membrane protein [Flavobacterium sp. MK4S-17]|uniref:RagB/SusD family nutrient uptake outer membrane protein n=1 Tax=Flavobacterium sp. MK4S-17 TaxID=2543737 RepID=UPI001358DD35|nr:RagB/SusD family nutrient uptake outer membrane protein [Flavobacterium sp. MK4S-17]
MKRFTILKALPLHMLALLLLCMTAGCEDYIEVDLPSSQLTASMVFEDKATATAAVTEIYAKMRSSGMLSGSAQGLSAAMGLYADELEYYGASTYFAASFYNNAVLPSTSQVGSWWSGAYNQVYGANAVLEGLAASQAISQADKEPLIGEALFCRALLHFYLLNVFGDIPYITTTDYRVNRVAQRMPSPEVYQMIAQDLEQALTLLPEEYITQDRTRPNRAAAQALLARVYLYSGQWQEAADMASAVLNNTALYSEEPVETTFLKESNATIWQFSPAAEGQNTAEGATFIFISGPPSFATLRQELMEAYEDGDLRKVHWVKEVPGDGGPWYHSNKYKERAATGATLEMSVVLRLAEVILIRSEARARQGDLIGALEDLNRVRQHAGLDDTQASGASEILEAILRERRTELFTEFGHRFFDLKRTANLDAALDPLKPGWQPTDALLPIPENELITNPNLGSQNPGY